MSILDFILMPLKTAQYRHFKCHKHNVWIQCKKNRFGFMKCELFVPLGPSLEIWRRTDGMAFIE